MFQSLRFIVTWNWEIISVDASYNSPNYNGLVDLYYSIGKSKEITTLEFCPDIEDITNLSKWTIKLDELEPSWWNAKEVRQRLEGIVNEMIIQEDKKLISGGLWIIASGKIREIKNSMILAICGDAKVGKINGSKVGYLYKSAKVKEICGMSHIDKIV